MKTMFHPEFETNDMCYNVTLLQSYSVNIGNTFTMLSQAVKANINYSMIRFHGVLDLLRSTISIRSLSLSLSLSAS